MSVDPVLIARSALGVASRYTRNGGPDPERVAAARRNLNAALVERAIRQALTAEPPITPEQCEQLAALLTGAAA
ncbi:hypothetical protein [Arthrobacter sp. ISL-65]|uniref:hypothetical protein n=1 Tax=Arthrobacter sp. ISL-65 TaxID=2819112 RepID=UPI001BEA8927|nr:hypothetical protein [Arthrobacter sp. ISL-65]MBT2549808.1 hypothetical protein [Arthrobacter sp. ISL-65]